MVFNAASVNFSTSCTGKVIPSQLSDYEDQINQRLFDKREKILTNDYFFQGRDHICLKETNSLKSYLAAQKSRGSDFLGGDSRSSGAHLRSSRNTSKALSISGDIKSERLWTI